MKTRIVDIIEMIETISIKNRKNRKINKNRTRANSTIERKVKLLAIS